MDRKTLYIVAAILAGSVLIAGAILYSADAARLRQRNAVLEAELDAALKTLHHERLLHFGTTSPDMEGRK